MPRFFIFISILVLSLLQAIAQPATKLPTDSAAVADSSRLTFTALIETPKASISGICLIVQDSDSIKGAIVNEFGITALDFVYARKDDKVRLESAAPMLDKWYMRPVITADIRMLLHALREGKLSYEDEKYHIKYTLSPIRDDGNNEKDNLDDDTEESTLPD